jgi:hypothetical protein
MKGIKNKLCPFCGGRPVMRLKGSWFELRCEGANCKIRPGTGPCISRDVAHFRWNQRADVSRENTYIRGVLQQLCKKELHRLKYKSCTDHVSNAITIFIQRKILPLAIEDDEWIAKMAKKKQLNK